jgi:ubiquinone/menaquinone biosynthesis C-methylase UbiE
MDDNLRGQVVSTAAEVYDEFFLPALFEEWPERLLEAARVGPGQTVLDVACGTGVLAMSVAGKVGPQGSVVGLDINEGMLAVARTKDENIDWRHGQAESLPFPDQSFDAVVSQFGLMFFENRQAAIGEMCRVLRPGGRLAIAVWDSLDNTPGYAAVTELLRRLFGKQAAQAIEAPYSLGDKQALQALLNQAGLTTARIETLPGTARFPSIESWMHTDIKGWTLASLLDDAQFKLLLKEARRELQRFAGPDGSVKFSAPAHIITASKS